MITQTGRALKKLYLKEFIGNENGNKFVWVNVLERLSKIKAKKTSHSIGLT